MFNLVVNSVCSSGRPSVRVVGIKGFDKSGLKIATNSRSAKAKDLVKSIKLRHIKYSRRANIADSAHFRETAKDAGAA